MKRHLGIGWIVLLALSTSCRGPSAENTIFYLQKRQSMLQYYERRIIEDACARCVRARLVRAEAIPKASEDDEQSSDGIDSRFQSTLASRISKVPFDELHRLLFANRPPQETKQAEELILASIRDQWDDLSEIMACDLPYMPTDPADPRAIDPIKEERPVQIIISRVYLSDNDVSWIREQLPSWAGGGYPQVAVVLEVIDGTSGSDAVPNGGDAATHARPHRMVAAVADRVPDSFSLPIGDILAYSTPHYRRQPLLINVKVVSISHFDSGLIELISNAAAFAKATDPITAGAAHVASQIGEFLSRSSERVLLTFAFQLYPERVDSNRFGSSFVPHLREGVYVVESSRDRLSSNTWDTGHTVSFDYGLNAYSHDFRPLAEPGTTTTARMARSILDRLRARTLTKLWPAERELSPADREQSRAVHPMTDRSFLVLKVASLDMNLADSIIDQRNRQQGELLPADTEILAAFRENRPEAVQQLTSRIRKVDIPSLPKLIKLILGIEDQLDPAREQILTELRRRAGELVNDEYRHLQDSLEGLEDLPELLERISAPKKVEG
ncbi:MAG: hypothetical protein KDC98_16675 [Planctomycetes bacterium]|nr:hypothetical protein [Planctomycetota bacterium]